MSKILKSACISSVKPFTISALRPCSLGVDCVDCLCGGCGAVGDEQILPSSMQQVTQAGRLLLVCIWDISVTGYVLPHFTLYLYISYKGVYDVK